jgi:hypothetical protein
MVSAAMA